MKKLIILILIFLTGISGKIYSQIKIGNNPAVIGTSSMLEIESITKGLVIPRMTGAQMNAIAAPVSGMFIYNTDSLCICQFNGAAWRSLCGGNIGSPYTDWHTTGNAATLDGTSFLGTTDNIPFNIRVNNQKSARIDNTNSNVFFGYQAGNSNTGQNNAFYGHQAGYNNSTGGNNTFAGKNAGITNTTGNNNSFIGSGADATASNFTNAAAIGYNAIVGASNSLVFGGTGANAVFTGTNTTTPNSRFQVNGSFATTVKTLATDASYTATANDQVIIGDPQGNDITVTLPSAVGINGRMYSLHKKSSGGKKVIVATTGSQTINGSSTYTNVKGQYDAITVVSDGANWFVLCGFGQ